MNAEFEAVKASDPIVSKILTGGGSLEDCIVALVAENRAQRELFGKFEIAVQRPCITFADGPQNPAKHPQTFAKSRRDSISSSDLRNRGDSPPSDS